MLTLAIMLSASLISGTPPDAPAVDVLVRGARVVDGTGNPWYVGDVALSGNRIVAVGPRLELPAQRVIDAAGLVVAPGFIDMHSHSDWLLLEDGNAQSKIRQGVTTEVLGESQSGGPFRGKLPPRSVKVGGETVSLSTLGEYLEALERSGTATNVATYVGLGNIWRSVMGDSFERPSCDELDAMKQLLDQAMRDGAFGLSSLLAGPPDGLATTDDIVALSEVVHRHRGIYASHIRNEGTGVLDAIREAIEIGARAGVPVEIIHLKIADRALWGRMDEVVELIEQARARGVNVQANVYPYTRGNNNLASIIPPWAHEGGRARMVERLRDPDERTRMKRDIREGLPGWYNHYLAVGGDWSQMLVNDNLSARNKRFEGITMDRIIALRSADRDPAPEPFDVLFDFLIEENGSISTIYAHHTEQDMNRALVEPWCSIGSDGSAYAIEGPLRRGVPHPRSFGTFPRLLGVYVRERKLLRLEDAVRKMTSANATMLGLADRGIIRPGAFADLVVFDPDRVIDRATYTDPFRYSEGIAYVLVNGRVVLDGETHTGARPGRSLRHRDDLAPRD